MTHRQLDAAAHGLRITGVKPTGNVCRADQWENVFVWSNAVHSKTFSEITIDIHTTH
jgi:hypothetical protein